MPETKISEGQSLIDVCLQELGTVAALFDLADTAGLSITDVLTPGQVLQVPTSTRAVKAVVDYFSARSQHLNTGDAPTPAPVPTRQRYFSNLFFNPDTYA